MQNDMLKNNIAPWQEKGRWYHLEFESTGTAWKLNKNHTDEIFHNSYFNPGYPLYFIIDHPSINDFDWVIMDIKFKFRKGFTGAIAPYSTSYNIYFGSANTQDIVLGPTNGYTGIVDCWVFIAQ